MSIYSKVDPGTKVYRSKFSRSKHNYLDMYPGFWYPIYSKIAVPGDIVKLGLKFNIKLNPSVTPFFTKLRLSTLWFAVPMTQLFGTQWGDSEDGYFEKMITGGDDGATEANPLPLLSKIGYYLDGSATKNIQDHTTSFNGNFTIADSGTSSSEYPPFMPSLSNCFGYPTARVDISVDTTSSILTDIKYPATVTKHRAYWKIYSDYLIPEDTFDLDPYKTWIKAGHLPSLPYKAFFDPDYFQSSLTDYLKGTAPALPGGTVQIPAHGLRGVTYRPDGDTLEYPMNRIDNDISSEHAVPAFPNPISGMFGSFSVPDITTTFTVNSAIDVSEMRLAFQTQRILERANRCGSRYTEYLQSNFFTSPSDGTLQRAYFIGGYHDKVVVPEILQTSEDGTTPQGNRAGVGFALGGGRIKTFHANQWFVVMGLAAIIPQASYFQGLNREDRLRTRFEFFNPSYQNLSEDVVENGEIYSDVRSTSGNPTGIFGYQGIYNYLRSDSDTISGNFRYSELNSWHMGLTFKSQPNLNTSFQAVSSYLSDIMRPFSVQNMPPALCDFYIQSEWIRPMVRYPVPGLIDHN